MMNPVAPSPAHDAPPKPVTFEEFLKLYDGQHAEWHPDGTVEIVVSNNVYHIRTVKFLLGLLDLFLRLTKQGEALQASFTQKIDGQSGREPDIMIVLNEHRDRIKETYLDGPADIAIEVVSPESMQRDYKDKFKEYASGGVREYWIIDIERRIFDVHVLGVDGRYARRNPDVNGAVTSGLLSGFALNPALLWQDELPDGEAVVKLAADLAGFNVTLTPKRPSA